MRLKGTYGPYAESDVKRREVGSAEGAAAGLAGVTEGTRTPDLQGHNLAL